MDLLRSERFIVASHGLAAAYAGWLLRQLGAEVDHATALDPEAMGAFLGEGARFEREPALRAHGAGVFITDAPVNAASRHEVEALARDRAVVWITPWGLDGPWSERPATDLCLQAAGGWMAAIGEPGREPLGPPGGQASLVAGLYGAIEAIAAAGPMPGGIRPAGIVDVATVEAVTATTIYDMVSFQYYGLVRERAGNRFSASQPVLATLRCKDGHIGLHVALHRQWLDLCRLIGHPELVSDPRFAGLLERAQNVPALDTYLLPWLAGRTRFEAYHELQQARIPASAHPSIDEVLDSPQLAAREAWREVTTPSGRTLRVPGPSARVLDTSGDGQPRSNADGPWAPGKLRVVDLAMGWAGPLVSHILACHGADVIKVEGNRRFDWWRGSRPPGDDPALALHERSHVFNSANRGKRGITLDLTTPQGCALARRLVASADVVVENFGTGVLERFGLTYESLAAENPGLILLRQPGFGSTGPEAGYVAFGNTIEGMSGLTALMGYEGGEPMMMSNALGDPVSGLNGTAAVMAALAARQRDGRGRCIEAAQLEGFLPMVAEALIEYQQTGRAPGRNGNRRSGSIPSGLFPCAGDDRWAAIEVTDDSQWAGLASLIGESWAAESELRARAGRSASGAAVAEALAKWTAGHDRDELVERLQAAGVPAAPVHNEADLLAWDLYAGRDYFLPEERAVVGLHLYPGLPATLAGERRLPGGPAPTLGQHNDEVLKGLGLSDGEIEALRRTGVTGETPALEPVGPG